MWPDGRQKQGTPIGTALKIVKKNRDGDPRKGKEAASSMSQSDSAAPEARRALRHNDCLHETRICHAWLCHHYIQKSDGKAFNGLVAP